jgi:hypothetical protein
MSNYFLNPNNSNRINHKQLISQSVFDQICLPCVSESSSSSTSEDSSSSSEDMLSSSSSESYEWSSSSEDII